MQESQQKLQDDEYCFPYHYVAQYYPAFTQFFNDTWGINYVATIEFLLQKLSLYNFNSIIDVGCGDGRFTKELAMKYPQNTIVGVDYSKRAIALAQAMNPCEKFVCANIAHDNIKEKFDVAILMEVFEHIHPDNGDEFIRAVSGILNNKGLLFMTVPHSNKPIEYKHFRHFDSVGITSCLEHYFDIVEIVPFEKKTIQKDILNKILTNDIFLLNHQGLRKKIYSYYKNKLFIVDKEDQCQRLFILAEKKEIIE